ncbi:hypothetical protein LX87_05670 [Larkinella arboricola]|uniref:Uncharacterized protein n=1 Tax=Larkinella arboricola TaxID=643671 RepID=A0A327WFY7_LARAB|nr:DNA-binding protein [Larkinella arboricola]RAJ89771.1 hypothetical protein LX87_05670 [Larkinella arboricola]
MNDDQTFLTIKEAAARFNKSELTIRRLVKQHNLTNHIRSEDTPKGKTYQVSQAFLEQHYSIIPSLTPYQESISSDVVQENEQLKNLLVEKDKVIQQLQNRLFEQSDVLNALINQMNSQKISHIEELLLEQNSQLVDLQKQLSTSTSKPKNWLSRFFRKKD